MAHGHRLGGGRGLIQHRGICNGHAGQIADHGLEVHQCLHTTLRDLRLIGSIGSVPAWIFQNIPANHRRKIRPVISHAYVGGTDLVHRSNLAKLGKSLLLGRRRGQIERTMTADLFRNGFGNQLLQRTASHFPKHFRDAPVMGSEMTTGETPPCQDGVKFIHPENVRYTHFRSTHQEIRAE